MLDAIPRIDQPGARGRARLGLGIAGLVAVVFGTGALVGALIVFGAATEDVTQHNGLAVHDAANLRIFTTHRSDVLVHAAKVVTELGAAGVVAGIAILASLMLWRCGLRLALAFAPAMSFGVAAVAVGLVKAIVGRARPPVSLHLVAESDASFPSGHATDSAAVFLTVALVVALFVLRRAIMRVLAVSAAGLGTTAIGATRLVLGVHWPSDVLAGWALGLSVALVVTMICAVLARLTPPAAQTSSGHRGRLRMRLAHLSTLERRETDRLAAV